MSGRTGVTTHMLETTEAEIAYDARGPLPTVDRRPPLFMIGQPMTASGFETLASHFPDRTVITYDPRGLGRSRRNDGRVDNAPTVQANDVHDIIEALGAGPIEMFASSGGAVTALALVAAYPDDVTTLVAHEPPLIPVLPDAAAAERARAAIRDAYEAKGSGAGMAAFITMASWRGEFTDEYFAQAAPDPAHFGCRPKTTAPATTHCYPTGPGPSPAIAPTSTRSPQRRRASSSPRARSRWTRSPAARRSPPPSGSVSRRPCSRATTAASSAASMDTPVNPRPSHSNCARCSTTTDSEKLDQQKESNDVSQARHLPRRWQSAD